MKLGLIVVAILLQNATPRPTPQDIASRQPNQISQHTQTQSDAEQRSAQQSSLAVQIQQPTVQTQTEPRQNGQSGPSDPSDTWSLSDKIAAWAIVIASLQFLALVVTVGVMILNGRRQLRAYVLPENSGLFDGTTLNPPQPVRANTPMVGFTMKNCGQTPAYAVISWAGLRVIEVRDENTILVIPQIPEKFSLTLGSGGISHKVLTFERALTPNEITDIANGVRAIYLYGRIEYWDAFKKRRYTNFRLHYTQQPFPPTVPNALLNFSERGNDSN